MDTSSKPLAIDHLKFLCKQCQCQLRNANASPSDSMLIHNVHPIYELAIISVILVRKDSQEKTGAEAIQILQKFPSLVPAG